MVVIAAIPNYQEVTAMYNDDPYCRVVDMTPYGGVKYCNNTPVTNICDSHHALLGLDAHLVEEITNVGFWITYCPDSTWFVGAETPEEGFHPLVLLPNDTLLADNHAVREVMVMVDWDQSTDMPVYETIQLRLP